MDIRTRFARTLSVATLLLASATAAGCGGADDDDPAVCSSVDALKSSVQELTEIQLNAGALADLNSGLDRIQADLGKVKDDAGAEFATEVDAVEEASSELKMRLNSAVSTPSLTTVSAVGTSIESLGTSLKSLADAVESTC